MALPGYARLREPSELVIQHDRVTLRTQDRVQLIDMTELVRERVRLFDLEDGIVNVQSRHTTAAIVVNENEPFLLDDFEWCFEKWAPREGPYRHNDLHARRFQRLPAHETENGDAHARALLLGASKSLNVISGRLDLGEWQRVFLVELDGPRERTTSILVMGTRTTP